MRGREEGQRHHAMFPTSTSHPRRHHVNVSGDQAEHPRFVPWLSSQSKTSASLLSPQVLVIIAANLDKDGLKALRLVCKDWCLAASDLFPSLFEHRRHVVSYHSLTTLIEITKHLIFGPRVKMVSLGTARVLLMAVHNFVEHEVEAISKDPGYDPDIPPETT